MELGFITSISLTAVASVNWCNMDPMSQIKVLYIDDDEALLDMTRFIIEDLDPDIRLKTSSNINEALDNYRNYDIILTDYEMHSLDGVELASRIRQQSDLPIIIYSNHGCEKIAEKAFTNGVNDYVRKEVEPEHYRVLAKRIKCEVDRYRSNRMLRESNERLRNIFQVSPHAIAVIDLDGRIIDCNRATLEMFGVETLEEVKGLNCLEFVAPGDILKAKRDMVNCIKRGFLKRVEYELVSDYGRRFP
ncbi:response regulator, partial [Candidatus Bathyarchaeota archaeon]|nr:response regulator [Candidatus Bathyarchaeota archaeon]